MNKLHNVNIQGFRMPEKMPCKCWHKITKSKSEICKCGHEELSHYLWYPSNKTNCKKCNCAKFKSSKNGGKTA